jgi:acetoacetate decarboxylase
MGFVKTAQEIERLKEVLGTARFVGGEMLGVAYRTSPEAVARVLPPGLEPADDPVARVVVGRWRSNSVGDFHGGSLYVTARRDGVVADYVVAMFMDRDVPLLFGRDLYGEPKKIASVGLYRQHDRVSGWIARGGVRLIEIDAGLGDDRGPASGTAGNFNVKALLAADGQGLHADAAITLAEYSSETHVDRPLRAPALHVRGTPHDPLDELPVLEILGGSYTEGDMSATCSVVGTIPAEEFLPYALGRLDDYAHPELNTERSPVLPTAG